MTLPHNASSLLNSRNCFWCGRQAHVSQLFQIFLTASLTLIGGCLLYLFSQTITELLIKPYLNYRQVLANITFKLILYANLIMSARPQDKPDEHLRISAVLREMSARLRSSVTALPMPRLLRCLRLIPREHNIQEAASLLIRISNCLLDANKKYDMIYQDVRAIGPLLKIDVG